MSFLWRASAFSSTNTTHEEIQEIQLEKQFLVSTAVTRSLTAIDSIFAAAPKLLKALSSKSEVSQISELLKSKAIPNANDAPKHLNRLYEIGCNGGDSKPIIGLCYLLLLKYADVDSIVSLVANIGDRVHRCGSAQRQAFYLLVEACVSLAANPTDVTTTRYDKILPEAQFTALLSPLSSRYKTMFQNIITINHEVAEATAFIHSSIEHFLDDFKLAAYTSTFLSPARFYFDACGSQFHRDHVNVHGLNGYIAIVNGWFGMSLPIISHKNDESVQMGCGDVWAGLNESAWDVFKKPENFGKAFEGIKGLDKSTMVCDRKYCGNDDTTRKFLGGNLPSHMLEKAKKHHKVCEKYAQKFAHFFRHEFLAKRMFENLNSECRPIYAGFRKSCETVFEQSFKKDRKIDGETSFLEHFYDDEMMSELNLAKAVDWFAYFGVLKVMESTSAAPAPASRPQGSKVLPQCAIPTTTTTLAPCSNCHAVAILSGRFCSQCGSKIPQNWAGAAKSDEDYVLVDDDKTVGESKRSPPANNKKLETKPSIEEIDNPNFCPLCMDICDDVEVLPHWEAKGDISTHRMCGGCRASYNKNSCPWCQEIMLKNELLKLINSFIQAVSKTSKQNDVNALAALFERWEFFELEYQSQPALIRRISKLIVQDVGFKKILIDGIKHKKTWLRDAAGLLIRFHCFENFGVLDEEKELLKNAVKVAEHHVKVMEVSGHHFGALYSQALVCYICAVQQAGGGAERKKELENLANVVKRIGNVIVKRVNGCDAGRKRSLVTEVPQRMHKEYLQMSSCAIWGSVANDIVWNAFY